MRTFYRKYKVNIRKNTEKSLELSRSTRSGNLCIEVVYEVYVKLP